MPISKNALRRLYAKAFEFFEPGRSVPSIDITFYPYVSVRHTIRVRSGRVLVRLSTLLEDAPAEVQSALATILVAKLLNRDTSEHLESVYKDHISTEEFRAAALENRRKRGRKTILSEPGNLYDLDSEFDKLNRRYFGNSLERPLLTWSKKRTYYRLGHFDEAHRTIVISRSLDDESVPHYVFSFVLFHEMLHIKHPGMLIKGRRVIHTREFKRQERRFRKYEQAEHWITENVGSMREMTQKGRVRPNSQGNSPLD